MARARMPQHQEVVSRALAPLLGFRSTGQRRTTSGHELHVDRDVVCPRCLCWIGPDDYVRLTRYGLHQHEACG